MPTSYQIRLCENPACGLRYPLTEGHPFGERCPVCLGETRTILTRAIASEAHNPAPQQVRHVEALLDNIRSAWNVGAMFRTADGLGVARLHLCGITPTPGNESVQKTALGAEQSIPWTYARNAVTCAEALKAEGATLWALEQDEHSIPLTQAGLRMEIETDTGPTTGAGKRITLIVGNEISGVDPGLLGLCERIVHIPMRGNKRSLNVEVAFGIAASFLLAK